MNHIYCSKIALSTLITCLSVSSHALSWDNHTLRAYLNAGPAWMHHPDTLLQVTEIETDSLIATNNRLIGDVGGGLSYTFPLQNSLSPNWLNAFTLGLGLRYTGFESNTLTGKVLQFQDPEMTNYLYNLSFNNLRLLAEFTLDIFSVNQLSAFVKGGVGGGWTQLAYHDRPIAGVDGGMAIFPTKNQAQWVGEVGAGLAYSVTEQWALTTEYLYTDFNQLTLNNRGLLNGLPAVIPPGQFDISSQALLFGIHWTC